jgi:sec-independent protein translocase protein TatA
MGAMSWIHWLIVGVIVLLLFGGRGKLSSIMGDAAKGIKAFQKGLKDEDKTDGAFDGDKPVGKVAADRDEAKR